MGTGMDRSPFPLNLDLCVSKTPFQSASFFGSLKTIYPFAVSLLPVLFSVCRTSALLLISSCLRKGAGMICNYCCETLVAAVFVSCGIASSAILHCSNMDSAIPRISVAQPQMTVCISVVLKTASSFGRTLPVSHSAEKSPCNSQDFL